MFLTSLPTHRPALVETPLLQLAHNTNSQRATEVAGALRRLENDVKQLLVRHLLVTCLMSDGSGEPLW